VCVAASLLAGATVWWAFNGRRHAQLPEPPDLSAADPEVVSFIRQQHAILATHRDDASAWAALAMAYEANGFNAASQRCYEEAVAGKPDEPKWWYRLASTQARSGDIGAALETEQKALALNAGFAPAFWRRGMWLIDRGDLDAASQAFQRAVDVDSADPAGWLGLARVSLQQRNPQRAIDLIRQLLSKHRPADPSVRRYASELLGTAFRQLGRADEARRAIAIRAGDEPRWRDPWTDELVYYRKGAAAVANEAAERLTAGQVDMAVSLFEHLRKQNPRDLAVLNRLAAIYGSMGRVDDSLRILKNAADEQPTYYDTQANLAAAYLGKNDLAAALEHVDRAIALQPQLAKAHETKGMILLRAGRARDAIEEFNVATRCDPQDVKSLLALATIESDAQRWDRARSRFQAAAAVDPLEIDALIGLAVAATHLGAVDEAGQALQRAMDLDPQDPRVRDAEAQLQSRVGSPTSRSTDPGNRPLS
jgi:tetratricopeptide (TPR) repeat protein